MLSSITILNITNESIKTHSNKYKYSKVILKHFKYLKNIKNKYEQNLK